VLVSGTVKWNGDALPNGVITFESADGTQSPASAKITGGEFRLRTKAGKKRVVIQATREIPGSYDSVMQSPRREQYIPERYNAQSDLVREVTAGGDNRFSFELTDKP
jgi:hypothetical protein